MLSKPQRLAPLVLCFFQATHYLAKPDFWPWNIRHKLDHGAEEARSTPPPWEFSDEADQGEEAYLLHAIHSPHPASSGKIGPGELRISDPRPAALPVAQTQKGVAISPARIKTQQAMDDELEFLHENLSIFNTQLHKEWARFRRDDPLGSHGGTNRQTNEHLRDKLPELYAICQLIKLFKHTERRLVLEPYLKKPWYNPMEQFVKRVSERMKSNKSYKSKETSDTKPMRKLNTNEARLDAGSEKIIAGSSPEPGQLTGHVRDAVKDIKDAGSDYKFLEGTSPEPGILTGDALDAVMDIVTWDWLKSLNDMLHKVMPIRTAYGMLHYDNKRREAFGFLYFQQLVFKTVEFLYKYEMIPLTHLKGFLAFEGTEELAKINFYATKKIFPKSAPKYYRDLWHVNTN
ncbi:hypothetical protein PTTG_27644 [Puccinia triticina 1-1 BBBD Race 1]|uniref:Uncharacterized protein n=1 Tax=Puccinia triticina (isolate 1-1 / race 1 (BBBD)) TaxID=630390 RepID=A0A180GIS5_PUCT1|nr:hypothetical protein PTTG_27644 [Puccinia triticina 1-1 BBBD Race 1]